MKHLLGIRALPLIVICVKMLIVFKMKNMSFFTVLTPMSLHCVLSMPSYSITKRHKMFVIFLKIIINLFILSMKLLCFMNRLAVASSD